MKNTPASEAAFARPYSEQQPGDRIEPQYAQEGMTMREYYAAHAPLPEFLSRAMVQAAHEITGNDEQQRLLAYLISCWSFRYADAMLKQAAK